MIRTKNLTLATTPVQELTFYDDVMSLNRKATMKLLEQMTPENLGFNLIWDAETRVDLVDQEMLFAMKKAGCRMMSYGIEHGEFIYEIKGGKGLIPNSFSLFRKSIFFSLTLLR